MPRLLAQSYFVASPFALPRAQMHLNGMTFELH
jgi:hypothetical protein